jgi:hypothetical protein
MTACCWPCGNSKTGRPQSWHAFTTRTGDDAVLGQCRRYQARIIHWPSQGLKPDGDCSPLRISAKLHVCRLNSECNAATLSGLTLNSNS